VLRGVERLERSARAFDAKSRCHIPSRRPIDLPIDACTGTRTVADAAHRRFAAGRKRVWQQQRSNRRTPPGPAGTPFLFAAFFNDHGR
jgi:hypothetical protein